MAKNKIERIDHEITKVREKIAEYSVSGSPCAASILHKSLRLSQQTFFIFGQEI